MAGAAKIVPPPIHKETMMKLNRHYLLLFLAFGLLGPPLPIPVYLLLFKISPDGWNDLGPLITFSYILGLLPALLTGTLVWALKLRRNESGVLSTLGLGIVLSAVQGFFFFFGTQQLVELMALLGGFSALCFCPFLPRPDSSKDKNHD